MTIEYVPGSGNDDGVSMGLSDGKISFYGTTAVTQATVTAVATGSTFAAIVTSLQALQQALDDLGLVLNA